MPLLGLLFLQVILVACAEVLAAWIETPLATQIGIIACGLASILGGIAETIGRKTVGQYAKGIVAAGAILIPGSLVVPRIQINTLDNYHAIIAWFIAATIFVSSLYRPTTPNLSESRNLSWRTFGHDWRKLALVWAFVGALTWLAASYSQNQFLAFHFGLAITVAPLILTRICFRFNVVTVQVIHALILFLIGLPLIDLFIRPSIRFDARPETQKHYYSYDVAKKNPVAFANWWKYYMDQWEQLLKAITVRDLSGKFPYLLRPGASGQFFQCHISINSKGFRGKEFSPDKGRTFRIVAIGESTTFGDTMNADDRPWPELLEEMIRTRLNPARPAEVINAGVPSHTLEHTLLRLKSEILPIKPDMIICYHGANGLHLLLDSLPRLDGARPPRYQPRPLKLLADAEYGLKIRHYKKGMMSRIRRTPPHIVDPMKSAYARAYETLIEAARTNHIRLAIANFSMAVNPSSNDDVAEFYRPGFPAVHWQVQANALHAIMVRQLVKDNPDVCFVDTQPKLDGFHEKFVDLVHLTQEGRQGIAEAFYAGIEKTLKECLAKPQENSTANK